MKPICFYHKADLDGVCSAAIVKHFVPECELYGIDYGETFPWELAEYRASSAREVGDFKRTVYMVDFSLPAEDMRRLAEISKLIWIDHHKTAIDAYEATGPNPFIFGVRRTDLAACELCWWALGQNSRADNEQIPTPEAVRLLGRYDVWDKDNPEWNKIMAFQYGCRTLDGAYDPASDMWPTMLSFMPPDKDGYVWYNLSLEDQSKLTRVYDVSIGRCVDLGTVILRYQAEQNHRACETGAQMVHFDDSRWSTPHPASTDSIHNWKYTALICNTTVFNSQFFDGFYDPAKHDVMCAYMQLANGKWKVSLYSTKPEIDCGAICKTFGGGGHPGAAGFVCDELPWRGC